MYHHNLFFFQYKGDKLKNNSFKMGHAWSTYENDSQDFSDKGILITKITPIEISSQYILILIT